MATCTMSILVIVATNAVADSPGANSQGIPNLHDKRAIRSWYALYHTVFESLFQITLWNLAPDRPHY